MISQTVQQRDTLIPGPIFYMAGTCRCIVDSAHDGGNNNILRYSKHPNKLWKIIRLVRVYTAGQDDDRKQITRRVCMSSILIELKICGSVDLQFSKNILSFLIWKTHTQ